MNSRSRFWLLMVLTVAACSKTDDPVIKPGRWTGSLSPMNHPDVTSPLQYSVTMHDDGISIEIEQAGAASVPVRDIEILPDRLKFTFNEPEENVELACDLPLIEEGVYEGRCTDAAGKWALFRMEEPPW